MTHKILFWDCETSLFPVWTFRIGRNMTINHDQIAEIPGLKSYSDILCIAYNWSYEPPTKIHSLAVDFDSQNSAEMIAEFDRIIKQADVVIAQNGDRFDVRHLNTQRLLHGGKPMPDWGKYTDDLYKQAKKYFYLPSYRLDYLSKLFGFGGKNPMKLVHWIEIALKTEKGRQCFAEMIKYCKKDVRDLRMVWDKMKPHIIPKYNEAAGSSSLRCKECGSRRIVKNGRKKAGRTVYQTWWCNDCYRYAGRCTMIIRKDGTIKYGRIGA